MTKLSIELLHNLTRTWDLYGGPKQIPLFLTEESLQELKGDNGILIYPGGFDVKDVLEMDGYEIQISVVKQ